MSGGRRRILIIDDEEDLVEMLALRLGSTGLFDVDKAFDGATGLDRARSSHPDVVLLDNVMPGLDGWEVCRRLRSDPKTKDISVVVMTAGSPSKAQKRGKEAQADHVVLKPYDHQELIALLQQLPGHSGPEESHAQAS